MYFLKLIKCLYKSIDDAVEHDGIEHAGYLTYLFMLSIFPFFVFLFSLAGFVGDTRIGVRFISLIDNNLPSEFITALTPRIQEIMSGPPEGLLTISIVGAIWTASSSVEGFRTTFNRAYRISSPPTYVMRRLLSIIQFIFFTFTITAVMFIVIFLPVIWDKFIIYFPYVEEIEKISRSYNFSYLRVMLFSMILLLVVATMYIAIPNTRMSFDSALPGAILVVILWMTSGYGLSIYINNFDQLNLIYGSLGGIIILLMFLFIMNFILIIGAEFNYLYKTTVKKKNSK